MGGKPKNSSDLAGEAKKGGKHSHKRGKHPGRPCPNPPAAPTGLAMTFKVREKKTHLEFSGKIRWNGVFEDEQGHKIPGGGVEIDHYEGMYWPTDATGQPIENEDGHARVRRFHKKSVKGVKVVDAEMISGTTAEYTTKKAHGLVVGEIVRVQDVKPGGYNGKFTITTVPSNTKFRADIGVSGLIDLEDEGTVEGQPDPNYNIVIEHFPNPRKWFWVAKVRAWDNKNCPSDWSQTAPLKPGQEARPEPPAPTFISLTFDRKGSGHHNPWRGVVKFNDVGLWDIPGFDDEDDVARYRVKIQVSPDGFSDWRKLDTKSIRDRDDEDEDAVRTVVFHKVRRGRFYRVWLASEDRFNRTGDYQGPYPSSVGTGIGGAPNAVNNVQVKRPAPRRFVATWDEPNEPEDVDYYKVEWWRRNPLTLMETNRSRNRNDVYRVPEADKGKTHFVKVYAVDQDNVESAAAQPGDQDETGDFGAGDAPGVIKKHAGPNIPSGWLKCNGDVYATSLHPALFAEIGYTYGPPFSGTTFAVPDFRKRHPRGMGTGDSLGQNDAVAEADRSEGHGDHKNHKHKHHHRRRRRDHSDDGGQAGDATPHEHFIQSWGTTGNISTVDKAGGGGQAAGPQHQHTIPAQQTNSGGNHSHGIPASSRRSPGSPFVSGFGQTAHVEHQDFFVVADGPSDVYQDSLVGGFRAADGGSWDAGPTDSVGTNITIDEEGAASGHKKHGHLKIWFIIKT